MMAMDRMILKTKENEHVDRLSCSSHSSAAYSFLSFFLLSLLPITLFINIDLISASDDVYQLKDVEVKSENGKPVKIFTADELKEYDASDIGKPIYMAIKGVVFDVSEGSRFYGKNGPYNVLVGIDSTRGVAKMSLEKEDLTHDISGLSSSTLKALDDVFEGTYMAKYPVVGYMDYLLEQNPEKFMNIADTKSEL